MNTRNEDTRDLFAVAVLIAFALLLIRVELPSSAAGPSVARSPIGAYAAATAPEPTRMPPPDANATEGNVVDFTY